MGEFADDFLDETLSPYWPDEHERCADATVRPVDRIIKVNGKSFRCECGCNVFRKSADDRYICNSCNAAYLGK